MAVEGGVAILAGLLAGSIALIGFGIASVIEGLASVIMIWRFTGARTLSEAAESRAQKLVAIQFFRARAMRRLRVGEDANRRRAAGRELARHRAQRRQRGGHALPRDRQAAGRGPARLRGDQGRGRQNMLCAYLAAPCCLACSAMLCSAPGGSTRGRMAYRSGSHQGRRRGPGKARPAVACASALGRDAVDLPCIGVDLDEGQLFERVLLLTRNRQRDDPKRP